MRFPKIYLPFIVALAIFSWPSFIGAQTMSAQVDKEKIRIGEKIVYKIVLEDVLPNSVTSWVNFPDSINHFEVTERGKIDTIKVDGMVSYQQIISITSFDSGRWEIPSFNLKVEGRSNPLSTSPIAIDVLPVDVSHLADYHDVKEIVEVEDDRSKLIIILIIITALIVFALMFWLIRKMRKKKPGKPVITDSRSPLEWALAQLTELQNEGLEKKGAAKTYYQRLTDISRQYFYRQLNQKATHQTTDEWMLSLQDLPIDNQVKTSFLQSIRLADTVKFAKYLPPITEYEPSLHAAADMFKAVAVWKTANATVPKVHSKA